MIRCLFVLISSNLVHRIPRCKQNKGVAEMAPLSSEYPALVNGVFLCALLTIHWFAKKNEGAYDQLSS